MNGALNRRSPSQRLAGSYQRFRQVIHEGAKFGIVGLIGIGVTNLVFIPLHALGVGPLKSITIATAVATVVTFLGNRYWSFRDREGAGTAREGVMFFILNGIGLLIQYAVLGLSNYVFGAKSTLENVIAVNLGIGLGTLFRFWSYRKWVWVPPEIRLAQLRRGRHRMGRDLSQVPPPSQQAAVQPSADLWHANGAPQPYAGPRHDDAPRWWQPPGAPGTDGFRPTAGTPAGDGLRPDSLGRVPAGDSSEQRRPRTPAAG